MVESIHGHDIKHSRVQSGHDVIHKYRCTNNGCYISAIGAFKAGKDIEKLAKEFDCPSGTNLCLACGEAVEPDVELCFTCYRELAVGPRV